jgi:hypothetical protein
MNVALPLASAVLSFVFAAMVFDQWRQRRHSFQLVWTLGLLWYGVSTGAEFVGGAFGWNDAIYRAWYLFGVFLVPSYLGAGTVYLLNKTRFGFFVALLVLLGGLLSIAVSSKYTGSGGAGLVTFGIALAAAAAVAVATAWRREAQAHVAMAFLGAGTLIVAALTLSAHMAGAYLDPATHAPVATAVPGYLRVASFPFTVGGGMALVFGALYSAYIYMPKKRFVAARLGVLAITINFIASLPGAASALVSGKLHSRVPATILIALGAFIPGLTSSLNRLGITWATFLGEFLGVLLIFVGFLVSEEVFRNVRIGRTIWSRHSLEGEAG